MYITGAGAIPTTGSVFDPNLSFTSVTSTNALDSCADDSFATAMRQFSDYITANVINPVLQTVDDAKAHAEVLQSTVIEPILKSSDTLLNTLNTSIQVGVLTIYQNGQLVSRDTLITDTSIIPGVNIPTNAFPTIVSQTLTVPLSAITTKQFLSILGYSTSQTKSDVEAVLRSNGIFIVNGVYLREGSLDLSCAKQLCLLAGKQSLDSLPYLSKQEGDFTTVITHKYSADTFVQKDPCAPISTSSVTTIEQVLGIDVKVDSILSTYPTLSRSDLFFYVFWNGYENFNYEHHNSLQKLGFTDSEIVNIFTSTNADNLKVCVIPDAEGVSNIITTNAADVVKYGPNTVDPVNNISDIQADFDNGNPSNPATPATTNQINAELLIALGVDPTQTSPGCVAAINQLVTGDPTNGLLGPVSSTISSVLAIVPAVQEALRALVSPLSALIAYAQEFISSPKGALGGFASCLLAGKSLRADATLFTADFIDKLQINLDLGFSTIVKSFDFMEKILTTFSQGLCLGSNILGGIGKQALSAATANIASPVVSAVANVGQSALNCVNFSIPWPDEIVDALECFQSLLNLIQTIMQNALVLSQNLLATIKGISLSLNLSVAKTDPCNPVIIDSTISAISKAYKSLT